MANSPLVAIDDLSPGDSLLSDAPSWMIRALAPLAGSAAKAQSTSFSALRLRLSRAGYRSAHAPLQYLEIRAVLAISLPALAWFSPLPGMVGPNFELAVPFFAFAIGYVGPSRFVDNKTATRQDSIHRDLPTALDLMVVCIEAGLGLMQTLQRVSAEMARSSDVLARELALVSIESRAGRSNAVVLQGLSARTGNEEVAVLVAMLIQTERFGTSLADSLRIHCDTMRLRQIQNAEAAASKAALRMLFPTSLILFAVAGLILGLAGLKALEQLG